MAPSHPSAKFRTSGQRAGVSEHAALSQPPNPPYFRVKIWRRLQAIGAVAVKASVYALPQTDAAREDFQWLLKEIIAGGGEAMICEAQLVDGLTDSDVAALFNTARAADYAGLAKDVEDLKGATRASAEALADREPEWRTQLKRLSKRFGQIAAIDFFDAPGRDAIQGAIAQIERQLKASPDEDVSPTPAQTFHSRTWVTRRGIEVDRIACAWLINGFIDPAATFKFVAPQGYVPLPGELRFDMFEAEFTHEGDLCSFEVFLKRLGLDDPGLRALGEIIHDIDLKDGKFGREETAGLAHMLEGLCRTTAEDTARIARASTLLDDLLAYLRTQPT
jgi:hypothetical protein